MTKSLIYLPSGLTISAAIDSIQEKIQASREDIERTINSFEGDILASLVFLEKYAIRNNDDVIEEFTLEEAQWRWARAIASVLGETTPPEEFKRLYDYYLPGGRQMFGLGHPYLQNLTLNNCVAADTKILTDEGLRPISKLAGVASFHAIINGQNRKARAWKTGTREVYEITTREGYTIKATEDHRFRTYDGGWACAKELLSGIKISLSIPQQANRPDRTSDEWLRGYATGLFLGDGTFAGSGFRVANIRLFDAKMGLPIERIAKLYDAKVITNGKMIAINSARFARDLAAVGIIHGNKTITPEVLGMPPDYIKGMLSGLFDADGSVSCRMSNGLCRTISFAQSDREMILDVQRLLLSLGIRSTIYSSDNDIGTFPKGKYQCRPVYKLYITRESFQKFYQIVGFEHPRKQKISHNAIELGAFKNDNSYARVSGVKLYGTEDVYDAEVDIEHCFWANGFVAHNCYATTIDDDSLDGIFKTARDIAKTFAFGGGQGIDLSPLRPAKSLVSNSSRYSTGGASFAELFSAITGMIGQHGRRGALLLLMRVDHPDIEAFINLKRDNPDKIRYANLSVAITDEFMRAVEADTDFELKFQTKHELITKRIQARDLWGKIVSAAHRSAEPGIVFWDTVKNLSPSDTYPELWVRGCNPCQPADATVLTPTGISTIGGVAIGDTIWSGKKWTKIINKVATGDKEVITYRTTAGSFVGTSNHKIVQRGEKIEVGNAFAIDRCAGPIASNDILDSRDVMDGLVLGDGTVHKASGNLVCLVVGEDDQEYLIDEQIGKLFVRPRFGIKKGYYEVETTIKHNELPLTYERKIPDRFVYGNSKKVRGFLRGLYSANGSVCGTRVTLKAASFTIIEQVQQLLSSLGIRSYYTTNKPGEIKWVNGTYISKQSYDLNITSDREVFRDLIGFIHAGKRERLDVACKTKPTNTLNTFEIKEKMARAIEPVFSITVDDPDHTYWTGGLLVGNCGEQPLESGGNCCLGSLLLHKFVENPFTESAWFNMKKFKSMIWLAVRHLDNVITLNENRHPLPEQKEKALLGRRIGLSITGLADMVAAMGLKYDSELAWQLVDDLMRTKSEAEYLASSELAKARGSFPLYDPDKHFERGFAATLPIEVKQICKRDGLRNVAISTVSPSGSISIIAHCSSGIEPVFSHKHIRYINLGGERKPFEIVHPGLVRGADKSLVQEAHEVNYLKRLELQACLQKYVDAAISSTINLPADISVETVGGLYMKAWKEGLKGLTIYRDGCREGVLVSKPTKEKIKTDTICYKFTAEAGDKFYVHVSYKDGDLSQPYQIFATNYKATEHDRFVKLANDVKKLIKQKGIPGEVLKDGESVDARLDKQMERSRNTLDKLTRFMSLALKCGYVNELCDVLDEHAFIGTLAARIHDILGGNDRKKKGCPSCGSTNIEKKEGCMTCRDCGTSACGS